MSPFVGLFTLAFLIFAFSFPFIAYENSTSQDLKRLMDNAPNFDAAIRYAQQDKSQALAIDAANSQFAVFRRQGGSKRYDFAQLVAVDVERDGLSLQKANRGSQLVGAAVGGMLLGPVGLLLGGLSGSKRNEERIRRLSLKIFTNDLQAPVSEIIFFDHPSGANPNTPEIKDAAAQLEQWYGRFRTIVLNNERAAFCAPALDEVPHQASGIAQPQAPMAFGRRRGLVLPD